MSPRDWQNRLQDILQAISDARQFTAGMTLEAFTADQKTIRAVAFEIAVIGEASSSVPAEIRERYPQIPWAKMRAMRNILVHRYFGLNLQILWDTVQQDLPALETLVKHVLEQEGEREASP